MMETARIRRAGYPMRHNYKDFVERYRHLGIGYVTFLTRRNILALFSYQLKTTTSSFE